MDSASQFPEHTPLAEPNALPEHTLALRSSGAQLEEAFTDSYILFNETTRKYMEAYKQLEEQFEYLSVKLEETNKELRHSLEEKDRVSNHLNNILESMSGGVLVVNLKGEITMFNRAAESITGLTQEEVLNQSYGKSLGRDESPESSVLYTLESGHSLTNREKELIRADGKSIPLGYSTSPVRDNDGNLLGAVGIFNDLTEVKRLESELQRVHTLAALGEMAATVAHEIRNPLGGIAGFAALLERDLEVQDPRRRLVKKISEGVGRLNRIVSSLLTYTRPLKLNMHPVELVTVVEESAAFLEIDLRRGRDDVVINRRYPETSPICSVDPEQFQQVVLNLLQNATQAMPDGGEVDIEVKKGDGDTGAVLCVMDHGIGMTEEVKEKLFTPFFTTKEDGTGLGLVTSKKIIDAHGGKIRVESQPGSGTCFFITIP